MKKLKKIPKKDFLFIIQARLSSKRFPNKILMPLKGKTILEHLYYRIKKKFLKSKLIIAIPNTKNNLNLKKFLNKKKLDSVQGSENDLIERFRRVSKKIKTKYIVRLTADNPLISLELIDYALKSHINSEKKFSSTRKIVGKKIIRFFPKGHSVDIINRKELFKIDNKKLTDYDREHLIPYFYKNYECNYIKNNFLKKKLKLKSNSIDLLRDYLKII